MEFWPRTCHEIRGKATVSTPEALPMVPWTEKCWSYILILENETKWGNKQHGFLLNITTYTTTNSPFKLPLLGIYLTPGEIKTCINQAGEQLKKCQRIRKAYGTVVIMICWRSTQMTRAPPRKWNPKENFALSIIRSNPNNGTWCIGTGRRDVPICKESQKATLRSCPRRPKVTQIRKVLNVSSSVRQAESWEYIAPPTEVSLNNSKSSNRKLIPSRFVYIPHISVHMTY